MSIRFWGAEKVKFGVIFLLSVELIVDSLQLSGWNWIFFSPGMFAEFYII